VQLPDGATLRANGRYELVVRDRLAANVVDELDRLDDTLDVYGALVPRDESALEIRSVSADTALLFLTLATPGPLPRYVRAQLGADADSAVLRLVIDGVLEVLQQGHFVTGSSAAAFLGTPAPATDSNRVRSLSVAALQYGQELVGLSESELAIRLYCYGRQPISPKLTRKLGDVDAVARHLGLAKGGPLSLRLEDRWRQHPVAPDAHRHWWQWVDRMTSPQVAVPGNRGYKLYLSPAVEGVGDAMDALVGIVGRARGVTGFKIGAGVAGLCRPDKIVVYFAHLDELQSFAERLRAQLAGSPAHGVAFTAPVTPDGLLSWGADPALAVDGRVPASSWRMWVTSRLAEHLVSARVSAAGSMAPWQFALERLRLAGIDTETWIPAGGVGLAADRLDDA